MAPQTLFGRHKQISGNIVGPRVPRSRHKLPVYCSNQSRGANGMDNYKGEIFQLYIARNKTLNEVMAIMKQDHGLDVSVKVFKTRLGQWGYAKNIKRSDAREILREKARRESLGKEYAFTLRQRPVDLEKVQRHGQRANLGALQQTPPLSSTPGKPQNGLVCRTPPPPPPLPAPTSAAQHWRVSEKLLFDIDILIKGSFEAGRWSFIGNQRIINSSPSQRLEVRSLHDFLGNLDIGCDASKVQDFARAGVYWQRAFVDLEALVKGQYHDIIPNLIQKLNDLNRQGLIELATKLKKHIARCSEAFLEPNSSHSSTSAIFRGMGQLDMAFMAGLEEMVMARFSQLFELYLGSCCYNSFVMMMNGARRRLLHNHWTRFEDCLPSISYLDTTFGPSDRWSLDVISLRVEVWRHRGAHDMVEAEAPLLIQRAEMIVNDRWQRFYNLFRGWYFLGSARYFTKSEAAAESLSNALRYDEELCKVNDFHIFNAEKAIILKYLGELRGVGPQVVSSVPLSHIRADGADVESAQSCS